MIFRQLLHEDLGCASYLVGDERAGVAAVVDPRFAIGEYLALARRFGVAIAHVFETHTHADHVSGHGRLAAATGARIRIHRLAQAAYEHEPFEHGDAWTLGALRIEALHTPGHRPEHTAFLLTDTARGPEPWAVLTGDSLFVGDVARPDLAIERREGARGVFRSLRERLLPLPDAVEVWPGHLGGSLCGGPGMSRRLCSTIGFERAHNPALALAQEGPFVEHALAQLGPQPPNFAAIVALNRGRLPREPEAPPPALSPRELELAQRAGALVVDVRGDDEFDEAHVPGAVAIPLLHGGFGTKLAWVAEPGQRVAFVGAGDEDGRLAAELAAAVGVRALGGQLAGGMASWRAEGRPLARVERVAGADLAALRAREPELQLLDVRERAEGEADPYPGARVHPWRELRELPDGLDAERPIAVVCTTGRRAATAASLLQRHGARRVIHVAGWS